MLQQAVTPKSTPAHDIGWGVFGTSFMGFMTFASSTGKTQPFVAVRSKFSRARGIKYAEGRLADGSDMPRMG